MKKHETKPRSSINLTAFETFLRESITPKELASLLDELMLDYGKLYIFAHTTSPDDYPLPKEINRIFDYVKMFSEYLKICETDPDSS